MNARARFRKKHTTLSRSGLASSSMGTLTSCSFGTVNLKLSSSRPILNAFDSSRKTTTTMTMKSKSLCYMCRRREEVSYRRFRRFRCSSSNDGNNNGDGVGVDSANSLGSRNELDSEKPPASASTWLSGIGVDPGNNNFQVDYLKPKHLGPDPADVQLIKDKIFGYSTFWVTREEPSGDFNQVTYFYGNLRGDREEVFAKLQRLLVEVTGDKYNLFMAEDPTADPRGGPRVRFGLMRKEVSEPAPTTIWQYVSSFLLFILTVGSSVGLGIAAQINRLPPEVVQYITDPDPIDIPVVKLMSPFVNSALPLACGVLGVLIFHEVGHFLAAYSKKVKLSIPFFIPDITFGLGSFGAVTQFKSILPDRSTQVDISLAGPFAGAVLSSSMFAVGLLLSSNPNAIGGLVQVPSELFQGSLLLGLISRASLGYLAMHAATVSIHPLVIAGWVGLVMTAFNMLPVGCLDGGRAMQGAFGKGALFGSGLITYALLGFELIGGPMARPWVLFAMIWQSPERPCLNDLKEVGKWRKVAVVVAIVLVLLTLVPVSDELAEALGIGLVSTF